MTDPACGAHTEVPMAYYVKKDKNKKKEEEKKQISGHSKLLAQLSGCFIVIGIVIVIWIVKTIMGA